MPRPSLDRIEPSRRTTAEPCPACNALIYRRVVPTEVTVHFDARLEYDGMFYYHKRHRCGGRLSA